MSQTTAAKATSAIAEICGVTPDELRSICASGPCLSDSLGFDSLMVLEMESAIEELGVEIARPAGRSDLGKFLESFIWSTLMRWTGSGHDIIFPGPVGSQHSRRVRQWLSRSSCMSQKNSDQGFRAYVSFRI